MKFALLVILFAFSEAIMYASKSDSLYLPIAMWSAVPNSNNNSAGLSKNHKYDNLKRDFQRPINKYSIFQCGHSLKISSNHIYAVAEVFICNQTNNEQWSIDVTLDREVFLSLPSYLSGTYVLLLDVLGESFYGYIDLN